MSIKFWRVPISSLASHALALVIACTAPVVAADVRQAGNDLYLIRGKHHIVVYACPHEHLFAASNAISPNGRWLIGRGTYEPSATRMAAEYHFVVDLDTGRRVLDRDFRNAFDAPNPSFDLRWLPKRPATLQYTQVGMNGPSPPMHLVLTRIVGETQSNCSRL